MIAAAAGAFGTWENVPRIKAAARQRAFRAQKRNVTRNEATQCDAAPTIERNVTPDGRPPSILWRFSGRLHVSRPRLPLAVVEALQAAGATKEMISAARVAFVTCEDGYRAKAARVLIEQGCDLEADILPIVAREVPAASPAQKPGAPLASRTI
jgi:hypothetical protein